MVKKEDEFILLWSKMCAQKKLWSKMNSEENYHIKIKEEIIYKYNQ